MGIAAVNGTTGRHERPDASVGADIDRRIDELHAAARDDDLLPSRRSEDDARRFLGGLRLTARPSLFLLDNGNFRAVWEAADGRQIGLQFQGDGVVQYVLFAPADGGSVLPHAGRETLDGVLPLIARLGLGDLLPT